jgi:hypothetical protein
VERSYVAKYPGDAGNAIKAIAKELLDRLAAANGAVAASAPAAPAPPAIETIVRCGAAWLRFRDGTARFGELSFFRAHYPRPEPRRPPNAIANRLASTASSNFTR